MRGHIRQRSQGSRELIIDAGRDPITGKRRQLTRTVRGTKKQAEAALADWIHAIETGSELDAEKLTVADFANNGWTRWPPAGTHDP